MRQWKLAYELYNQFSLPVTGHFYSLRCFPQETEYQKIRSCSYEVQPCEGSGESRDSFGNKVLYGHCQEPHGVFRVRLAAVVETHGRPEPEKRPFWQLGMFRCSSPLTVAGKELRAFADGAFGTEKCSPWEDAARLMDGLYGRFSYVSGSTCFTTPAEAAFVQGCGVCQDYAHILLALCRYRGVTARYVAGAIPGEGASHAWIEVWQDGYWKGFDPTNNREVQEDYICFAYGRDAGDCELSQGIFRGAASQSQQVTLRMEEQAEECACR